MAHEIDESTGRAAAFYAGSAAWHGLGTVVAEAQTSAEAIRLAGLDWEVEQWPVFACRGEHVLTVPGQLANVRTDTQAILGVVSDNYRVFQNREAFAFLDEVVRDRQALYETAGALKGGKKIWLLARLPGELRAVPGDTLQPYALLATSHDGSMAVRILPTTVRVVCQNTLNVALRAAGNAQMSIRHTDSLHGRIEQARQILGLIDERMGEFETEIQALARRPLSTDEARSYFEDLFPTGRSSEPQTATDGATALAEILNGSATRRTVTKQLLAEHAETQSREQKRNAQILEQILNNYENRDTNALPGVRGTAWAAFNAVTDWADHQRPVRGKDDTARAENRLSANWFGESDAIKQHAYQSVLELVR